MDRDIFSPRSRFGISLSGSAGDGRRRGRRRRTELPRRAPDCTACTSHQRRSESQVVSAIPRPPRRGDPRARVAAGPSRGNTAAPRRARGRARAPPPPPPPPPQRPASLRERMLTRQPLVEQNTRCVEVRAGIHKPLNFSGAAYSRVPRIWPVAVSVVPPSTLTRPQSAIFRRPDRVIRAFLGFRSRCTRPVRRESAPCTCWSLSQLLATQVLGEREGAHARSQGLGINAVYVLEEEERDPLDVTVPPPSRCSRDRQARATCELRPGSASRRPHRSGGAHGLRGDVSRVPRSRTTYRCPMAPTCLCSTLYSGSRSETGSWSRRKGWDIADRPTGSRPRSEGRRPGDRASLGGDSRSRDAEATCLAARVLREARRRRHSLRTDSRHRSRSSTPADR